ncbi:PAS domain-containing SpoIIE family protein phosphatase/ATP-binding protein [Streptomyces sp. 15-116A]|uniref:SpoIIE family protein phosphatase n=1 Tax=Streptomyces sp. 15-116A TaxID=2259035 RepID=UPI0021B15906|nr:SpoIIE family protein phosphatase [Streptomyces sp. 15-116A]MCT7351983.1 PAS domain-containing SpoIIE family protein phosphatase/ATP-binding protein [Streptomyces sp. 15-116A]
MGGHKEQDVARQGFDVADAAPLLLDPQGVVASWTAPAERLLGYPASEAVGRKLAELLTAEDAERVPELVERCRTRGGWTGPLRVRHRDGRPVGLLARVTPTVGPRGRSSLLVLLSSPARASGWATSRTVLEQLVAGSPIGIAIVDTDLRFVWCNAALEQFGGGGTEQRLGLRFADIQPGLDADAVEDRMRHVLATGEPVVGYEHVGRIRSAPLRQTAHMMSFNRLDDERGRPMGVYYTVVDITERHRARQRLALLDRAGEHIGRSLDIMRTAQELADVTVPGLADVVTVDLLETVLRGAELPPGPLAGTDTVALRRAGQQASQGELPRTVVEIGDVAAYLAGSPPVRCLTSGRSWRQDELTPLALEWAVGTGGDRENTFLELGLQSVMIVPIRARGVTLGVTTFFRRHRQEPFDRDDMHLAEELVARAALCVDNARRYTRERDAALVLQRSLLPRRLPEQDAVEVSACYRPADELTGLGGDWYDLIPLSGARVALVVGEVPGHGIDAAAAMGRLRTAVRTLAALDLPPEEVLAHLDDLVARSARDEDPGAEAVGPYGQDVGSGCVYVVYDPVEGRCTMAAAGHPAPAVVTPGGTVTFVELPQGPALGVGGPPFESVELTLDEGSTLALHTDGLLAHEGRGEGEDGGTTRTAGTGPERLRAALAERATTLDRQCRAVVDALAPARPYDDVALLMARTRRLAPGQVAVWDLPADPAVVAEARRTTTRQLTEWGLEDLVFTTELVVSELVTNAIRYAGGPVRLRLIRERALVCEVFDGGATAPHLRHPRAMDEGGRGLLLVSQLAQRWGTRFVADGKIIWAEQSLTGPAE